MVKQESQAALIIVDLQHDFCRGGALEVPDGDAVVPIANQLQTQFDLVVATKDWHPKDHTSFVTNHPHHQLGEVVMVEGVPQILWPEHCVQGSKGAELHADFNISHIHQFILKGVEKDIDSYSAFFDNAHLRHTGLADYLQTRHVKNIYLMGLATDYCVKYSCLDALNLGFNVFVIVDGCRGVDLKPGDVQQALAEMQAAGATLIYSQDLKL